MLRSPDVMRSSSALMPKRERCFWKAHLFYFGDFFFFVLLCFCFFTASQGVRIRVPYVRESRSDTAGQSYKSQQASARICQNVRWVWFSSLHLPATRLSLTTHTCQVVTPKYRICLCVFLVTRPSQCFFVFLFYSQPKPHMFTRAGPYGTVVLVRTCLRFSPSEWGHFDVLVCPCMRVCIFCTSLLFLWVTHVSQPLQGSSNLCCHFSWQLRCYYHHHHHHIFLFSSSPAPFISSFLLSVSLPLSFLPSSSLA